MPYSRRNFGRFARRRRYGRRRVGAPLGRPRWNRQKRVAQGLTRNVFWFKATGPVEVLGTGTIVARYNAFQAASTSAFQNFARSFEQYKVLKVIVKLWPASVGSESVNPDWFHRGNALTYLDQPPIAANPPASINEVMSLPSARLFNPRRMTKRYMNRPKGGKTNTWPLIDHDAAGNPATQVETWESTINLYGDNFGNGSSGPPGSVIPPYFFYEQYFKVLFRSRYTQ